MIQQESIEEWKAFDRATPAPTFFARPAWALSLAQTNPGFKPALLRIRTGDDKNILLPMIQVRGGAMRWREFKAFPMGGYTCFMHEDGTLASAEESNRALNELSRYADAATVIPWPLAPAVHSEGRPHETSVIDLRGGIEAALANVEGIFRRMAGQAQRRGVVCELCSGPDAVERYYAILEDSAKRWGLEAPKISRELLYALRKFGGDDVEIWLARAEGRDIGGGVVFYGSQELFFWSAAMLSDFGRLRPSNALNFALMRAAAARGMLWYNLGSSEGLPGVARFKHDLGTTDVGYTEIELARARFRIYTSVRRAIAARPVKA